MKNIKVSKINICYNSRLTLSKIALKCGDCTSALIVLLHNGQGAVTLRTYPALVKEPCVKIRFKNKIQYSLIWQPLYFYTPTSVQMPTWATFHGRLVLRLIHENIKMMGRQVASKYYDATRYFRAGIRRLRQK